MGRNAIGGNDEYYSGGVALPNEWG